MKAFGWLAGLVAAVLALIVLPRASGQTPLQPPVIQTVPVQQSPLPQIYMPNQAPLGAAPRLPSPTGAVPSAPTGPGAAAALGGQGTPAAAAPPENWQPRGGVELRALDKVNARTLTLSGRVGQVVKYGSLSILVRSCMARPADQEADSAAFLEITDARPNAPSFRGWMFANEPAVAMFEHPIYDIRVVDCRP